MKGVLILAAVGEAATGAAAATSSACAAGVATGSANIAAATSAAYSVGVATGASIARPAAGAYVIGVNYASLPAGCITPMVSSSGTYYLCGNTSFQPSHGANGVFYKDVPAP